MTLRILARVLGVLLPWRTIGCLMDDPFEAHAVQREGGIIRQHLGIAQTVESPKLGPTTIIGQAFRLSRTPSRLVRAAPECGADTDDILRELGYGADAIAALRARQVI